MPNSAPVHKNLFYGFFVGTFGGAVMANLVAGVNTAATTALLIVLLAFAIIGVALVAFKNDERLTEIENADFAEKVVDVVVQLDELNKTE